MDYESFKNKYAPGLNSQQEEAVRTVDGNVLLLAVPGSGKTTVLVTRLGYMLACCGIPRASILVMTYTVAATGDMRRRFVSIFGEDLGPEPEFRTINGVCSKIIRTYEETMHTTAFTIADDDASATGSGQPESPESPSAIIRALYRDIVHDYPTDSDILEIRRYISYAKNMLLTKEEIEALDRECRSFSQIYEGYRRIMRENRRMDYDDQLVYAYSILRRYPDILNYWRSRFRYICVDEAQDTSKIQHCIIDLLAGPGGNLFMVGDEDQSIYGFRAAYPEALVNFEKNHPGAKVLLMEHNYRSTGKIVSAADAFIRKNENRHEKNMLAVRPLGDEVVEIPVYSRRTQYAYIEKIAAHCVRETAVLYRDNECALPIIDALQRAGITYRCRGVDSTWFSSRTVRDLTDIITFSYDRTDGFVFLRIYYKLGAGISRHVAESAARDCPEDMSLLLYIAQMESISAYTRKQCRALETHMRALQDEDGGKAVYRILHFMGYLDYMKERGTSPNKAEIMQLIGSREPSPRSLLARLDELQRIVAEGSTDPDSRFVLSTIHSSKGLEYDRVYLMDAIDGVLPSESCNTPALLEEERRLFYVAVTRAKNELNIFTYKDRDIHSCFTDAIFGREKKGEAQHGGIAQTWKKKTDSKYAIKPVKSLKFTPKKKSGK